MVHINPETGEEEFTPCQRRCSTQYPDSYFIDQIPLKMEVFDILSADNTNLEETSYMDRKEKLHELLAAEDDVLPENSIIEYVPYEEDLVKAWNEAITKHREGLIVKQSDSGYQKDNRSYDWLKVKNWRFETCDVIGFTPGERARAPFFGRW